MNLLMCNDVVCGNADTCGDRQLVLGVEKGNASVSTA